MISSIYEMLSHVGKQHGKGLARTRQTSRYDSLDGTSYETHKSGGHNVLKSLSTNEPRI